MNDPLLKRIIFSSAVACLVSAVIFMGFYPKGSAGLILTAVAIFMNAVAGFINYRRYTRMTGQKRPNPPTRRR